WSSLGPGEKAAHPAISTASPGYTSNVDFDICNVGGSLTGRILIEKACDTAGFAPSVASMVIEVSPYWSGRGANKSSEPLRLAETKLAFGRVAMEKDNASPSGSSK